MMTCRLFHEHRNMINTWWLSFYSVARFLAKRWYGVVLAWPPDTHFELNDCWCLMGSTWAVWKYGEVFPLFSMSCPNLEGLWRNFPGKATWEQLCHNMTWDGMPQCMNLAAVYPWLTGSWHSLLQTYWYLEVKVYYTPEVTRPNFWKYLSLTNRLLEWLVLLSLTCPSLSLEWFAPDWLSFEMIVLLINRFLEIPIRLTNSWSEFFFD